MLFISPRDEYPRHYGDIQLEHPDWKLGDALPEGWVQVAYAEKPLLGVNETYEEQFPIDVDGVKTQNFVVRAMTEEEIERRDAPETARQKLLDLGLTDIEIDALIRRLR